MKEYSNKAFKDKFEVQQTNSELEQNHFQLKQELKDKEQQLHKFENLWVFWVKTLKDSKR